MHKLCGVAKLDLAKNNMLCVYRTLKHLQQDVVV